MRHATHMRALFFCTTLYSINTAVLIEYKALLKESHVFDRLFIEFTAFYTENREFLMEISVLSMKSDTLLMKSKIFDEIFGWSLHRTWSFFHRI